MNNIRKFILLTAAKTGKPLPVVKKEISEYVDIQYKTITVWNNTPNMYPGSLQALRLIKYFNENGVECTLGTLITDPDEINATNYFLKKAKMVSTT